MGRNIPIVSFLCGVIFRRKPPAVEDGDDEEYKPAESPPTTPSGGGGGGGGRFSPEYGVAKPCSPREPQLQPLPLPPGNGNFHMRTVSCGHNMQHHLHRRTNSGVSKLMSSMSLRVMGGGGGGGGGGGVGASSSTGFGGFGSMSGREDRPRHKERPTLKYFKHEDSVWKKTIILGERCRVPSDDDDDINLYDEKGKKITSYHPKSYSGLLSYSRQNTSLGRDE